MARYIETIILRARMARCIESINNARMARCIESINNCVPEWLAYRDYINNCVPEWLAIL